MSRNEGEYGAGESDGKGLGLGFKGRNYRFGGPHPEGFYYTLKPGQFKSSAQIATDRAKADADFEESSQTSGYSTHQSTRRLNPYKTQSAFLELEARKKHMIMIKPWTEESQREAEKKRKLNRQKKVPQFKFRTLQRITERNELGGSLSRWEQMAIRGKEARRKATEGELLPNTACKHQRPFSSCTTRHGPLDRGKAAQARDSCLLENDMLRTLRPSASTPSMFGGRRETISRNT